MFDFDASKLIIVGIVALIFIPPKDLPRVLRQAGQFVGKMRRMASEFQGQFMDAMREADMADLRNEARKLAESTKVETGLGSMRDMNARLVDGIERKSPPRPEQEALPPHAEGEAAPALEAPRETTETPREPPDGAKAPLPHSA